MRFLNLGLLVLLGCEGGAPKAATIHCIQDRSWFADLESETQTDCVRYQKEVALAEEFIVAYTAIPRSALWVAAARNTVHARDVNAWWDDGPVCGEHLRPRDGRPGVIMIDRGHTSLVHEWIHAWEEATGQDPNPDHLGWTERHFNQADWDFAHNLWRL